jgi:hypothetical protein
MQILESFIVKAKANGWVGSFYNGKRIGPSRKGSCDIIFEEGDWHYHDSFVGFSDFCGQEHVTIKGEPVWSMVYYGYLLQPERFTGDQAVKILKEALGKMYAEGRFLGGFLYKQDVFEYRDMNIGDFRRFNGIEKIIMSGELVYELVYGGGTVRK